MIRDFGKYISEFYINLKYDMASPSHNKCNYLAFKWEQ